jgi:hypothetical protein
MLAHGCAHHLEKVALRATVGPRRPRWQPRPLEAWPDQQQRKAQTDGSASLATRLTSATDCHSDRRTHHISHLHTNDGEYPIANGSQLNEFLMSTSFAQVEPSVMADSNISAGPSKPIPPSNPEIQKMVASKRLQQAQAQVGEVIDIMRVNVEKVIERDQKLSELDRRADDLQEGASQFQQQAVKLKRKYWWENLKMWLVLSVVALVVLLIIVVSTAGGNGTGSGSATSAPEHVLEAAEATQPTPMEQPQPTLPATPIVPAQAPVGATTVTG